MQNIFLDRDGTILENIFYSDTGSYEGPRFKSHIKFIKGALKALKFLQNSCNLFIISNQPNASKEKTSIKCIHKVNNSFKEILEKKKIKINGYYYSYHHPKGVEYISNLNCKQCLGYKRDCICRKPSNFFLKKVLSKKKYQNEKNWFIGDRETDMKCGNSIKAKTILVTSKKVNKTKALFLRKNLYDALDIILK